MNPSGNLGKGTTESALASGCTHIQSGIRISPAAWVSVPPLPQSQHLRTKAQAQAQASKACLAASSHLQSRKGRVKQPDFLLKAA